MPETKNEYVCIVTGSRSVTYYKYVANVIDDFETKFGPINTVISGGARGPDTLGATWARVNNRTLVRMPAEWEKYGRRAGPIRNNEMAIAAKQLAANNGYKAALVAIWDGTSRGTKHMIESAKLKGLLVHVVLYSVDNKANKKDKQRG